ncbi:MULTISPECIES: hypothetical protein [unclassified Streptomyces]|uniref:hypothetical protein n=1 Tax=unclassified Streptomyces TaxID=2593676 RepID=UPI0033DDB921
MPRRDLMLLVSRAPDGAEPGEPFAGATDASVAVAAAFARPTRLPRPTGPDALPHRAGPRPDH